MELGPGTSEGKRARHTQQTVDAAMMRRALFHAARGAGRTTPNPMVGAVVLSAEGLVVGHGWHEEAGQPHAEVNALDEAGDQARGGTLYVTLEPCCHTGRTGPCTERVIHAGIRRVVAAMRDPDPRVSGCGFAKLQQHGIDVVKGICEADAERLNRAFVTVVTKRRPLVIMKAATSLDARVASGVGARTPISSKEANRKTQVLRASVDAIAVGSETVLVDDPLLTVRDCYRIRPLVRVIFDRRLRTLPTARIFSTLDQGPVIMMTGSRTGVTADRASALEAVGAVIVESPSLSESLTALLPWQVSTLLLEGGPALQAAFSRAGLVDRLHLIVAPHVVGSNGIKWMDTDVFSWTLVSRTAAETRGPDTWIEADVYGDR